MNLVKGLRRRYETDGLIVLVDTCYSGTGVVAAGKAWPSMGLGEFRFEFLAAAADRPAFDGCFSKRLVQWVRKGMSRRGRPPVRGCAQGSERQVPEPVSEHVFSRATRGCSWRITLPPRSEGIPSLGHRLPTTPSA